MPSRLQVDPNIPTPALRPQATPVDTFEQTNAGNELHQIASGLAQLSPALARFTSAFGDKYTADQTAAGTAEARRMAESGQTYKQLADEGKIPRGANPWFIAGFREQWGRVTADTWKSNLIADMAKDEKLQTSTNVADFDAFVQQHRQQFMDQNVGSDTNDKFFQTGFGFRADAYTSQLREEFARGVANRVEQYADDAHFGEITNAVIDHWGKASADQIAGDINQLNTDAIAQGRDPGQVNRMTVKAVAEAAMRLARQGDHRALDVLQLLGKIKGGSGMLDRTTYGTEALLKTTDDVNNALWDADQRERQVVEQKRQDDTRSILSDALTTLAQNPNADVSGFVNRLAFNPSAAADLAALKQNVMGLKYTTNEDVKNSLFTDIWTNPGSVTPQAVASQARQRNLTPADAAWLIGQIDTQKSSATDAGNRLFNDFQFEHTMSILTQSFSDPTTGVIQSDKADRVRYAQAMLMQRWAEYMGGAGGSADPVVRGSWLKNMGDLLISYVRGPNPLSISQSSAPAMKGTDPLTTPVLTSDDLQHIRSELQSGSFGDWTMNTFRLWNLTTPEQQAAFVRAQLRLAKPAAAAPPKP